MLSVDAGDAYAVVTLNRPEKRNALAREIAAGVGASPQAAFETKRRVLLDGERSWMPLLEDEVQVLRRALLGS